MLYFLLEETILWWFFTVPKERNSRSEIHQDVWSKLVYTQGTLAYEADCGIQDLKPELQTAEGWQ